MTINPNHLITTQASRVENYVGRARSFVLNAVRTSDERMQTFIQNITDWIEENPLEFIDVAARLVVPIVAIIMLVQ